MTFDLYTLDKLEDWDDEFFEQYLCDILLIFDKSPEAQEFSEINPEISIGFWVDEFIHDVYISELTLIKIDKFDALTIILYILERYSYKKILVFHDYDDCHVNFNRMIPELIAFWKFLKREYNLDNADEILELLAEIESDLTN
jgi:hypothetical protein